MPLNFKALMLNSEQKETENRSFVTRSRGIRKTAVTFKLRARPPFSNASKMLISDGEITSGSAVTANHMKRCSEPSQTKCLTL